MKTTISKLKYLFFLIVIAGFVSCKGEIGPPGADGTNGIDGVDGTDGANGSDGNANVISSDWIAPAWTATGTTDGDFEYLTEDITEDIINTGVILSYCDWNGDGEIVYHVPFTMGVTYRISFLFRLKPGSIIWEFRATINITPSIGMMFRYVIIPSSGNKSDDSKQAIYDELDEAGVDINNYYEVIDYYGLEY